MSKGVLITFEGGEGAGKTTIIDRIYQTLLSEKYPAIKTIEPGGTPLGEEIRKTLLFSEETVYPLCELALFLASRSQHVHELIIPSLERGMIVLCDRFHDSSIAYQGIARGLGKTKIKELSLFFSSNIEPHLTLYLDVSPKIGLSRSGAVHDRIEQETMEFHEKVRSAFLQLQEEQPKRIKLIDATQSIDAVFLQVMKYIRSII